MPELWLKGPKWLIQPGSRPPQPQMLESSSEILAEKVKEKQVKVLMTLGGQKTQFLDFLCQKQSFWKLVRITAWILRFKRNCLSQKTKGALITDELNNAERVCICQA